MKIRTSLAMFSLCAALPIAAQAQGAEEAASEAVGAAEESASDAANAAVQAPDAEAAGVYQTSEAVDAGTASSEDCDGPSDCDRTDACDGDRGEDCDGPSDCDRAESCDRDSDCGGDTARFDNGEWTFDFNGYVRTGYRAIQRDDATAEVGNRNGFRLHNVRVGFEVEHEVGASAVVSIEGASSPLDHPETAQAELFLQLKDAYVRHQINDYVGVQLGQFKAPWAHEELMSTGSMLFVDRAVGFDGLAADQSQVVTQSLELDRQIGIMIDSGDPIELGDFRLGYALMIANGNGPNRLVNDNRSVAAIGRLTLGFRDVIQVGFGAYGNKRVVNDTDANRRTEEKDFGLAADLLLDVAGFNFGGQFAWVQTEFPTVGEAESTALAGHAFVAYQIDAGYMEITPAYRYAYYDPYFGSDSSDPTNRDDRAIQRHTIAAKFHVPTVLDGTGFSMEYTVAVEEDQREYTNNQFDLLFYTLF